MRMTRTAGTLAALALVAAACGGTTADEVGGVGPGADDALATADDPMADGMDEGAATDGDEVMGDATVMDDGDHVAGDADHAMGDDPGHDDDPAMADGGMEPTVVADRVVMITMTEFAFTPDVIDVAVGETVQFVFTNTGVIEHEAVLGDAHVQDEHEAAMQAMDPADMGDMDHGAGDDHHGAIPSVTVTTGAVGTFTHTFTDASELLIGCHLPGHWDAGMIATVRAS